MTKSTIALTLAGLVVTAAPSAAAPIIGSAGAGLQTMGTPTEDLTHYWDGNSWDSHSIFEGGPANPCSAGSLVSGIPCELNTTASSVANGHGFVGSSFAMPVGDPGYQVWGYGDGSADPNFGFLNEPGGSWYEFTMFGEFTDDWNVNEIGWYELDNPNNRHTIFSASAAVGDTTQVYIPTNFGFYYLNTSGNGEMFFTQSLFNQQAGGGAADKQQFAAFQFGDMTVLGVEDIFSHTITQFWQDGTADYDYNDVMFGFRAASVPEPGTLLLLGMGLAGFGVRRLRRR